MYYSIRINIRIGVECNHPYEKAVLGFGWRRFAPGGYIITIYIYIYICM